MMEKKDEHMMHRVITMLDRDEMDFLDKIGKDALFTTGHKLTYTEILKGLIDFAKDMGLSGEKVSSLDAFKQKMMQQVAVKLNESATERIRRIVHEASEKKPET
jgi:enoyl reductase-like protein